MPENKDFLNKKLKVSTRIVADNGIGELFPSGNIHQEIYNQVIPPYGTQGQQEYQYHRIPTGSAGTSGFKYVKSNNPPKDIIGCHCDETLRGYCEGKDWCPCCASQSDGSPSSKQREKILIPKFNMAPLGETGGRSANGGGRDGTSHQSNVNNGSNGGGGGGPSPKESSVGSKYYPGGERGERRSKDESRHRRRSSRDDEICEDPPSSNRETGTSCITRRSDSLNRNEWIYSSTRNMPRSTITVSYDVHQTPDGSCGEEAAHINTMECRSVRVNSDPCSSIGNRSPNAQHQCAPMYRLSSELSPVISTGRVRRRRSTRESTCDPTYAMRRASDEDNQNCEGTSSRISRNDELRFGTSFHDGHLVQQNAGDAAQPGHSHKFECIESINCSSTSVPPTSYILAMIILWLVILSWAMYALLEKRKVYDGMYP